MSNRAIIYARVSTEEQLEKYGIPSQLRACREYAASHNLAVVQEITDDGISGTVLARPGLDRLRKLVTSGECDAVLAYDVDRLSRDLGHLLVLKPEIERRARLEFVASKFEDSPSGRLFFNIQGSFATYEREIIRQRTMRGKRERAAGGLIVGGRTAYGYRYDAGRLIPEQEQAQVVREIFGWYDGGLSIRGITRKLRENGIPTWGKDTTWGHSTVRRILVNETYAGTAHYGTLRREGNLLKARTPVDRIDLMVPALVEHGQWARVQGRMAAYSPKNGAGRHSSRYLLCGLLHCSCGKRMSGNCRRGFLSYRCNGRDSMRAPGSPMCRLSLRVSSVDTAVWQSIAGAFSDEQTLRAIISRRQKELHDGQAGAAVDVKLLREKLAKLHRKEKLALAAMLDPDLADGRDLIKAELRKVQQERARLEWDVATAERASRSTDAAGCDWIDSTVELIRGYIPTLQAVEQRQEFLRGLVSRVDWNDAAGEVKINCLLGREMGITSSRSALITPFEITLTARVA